MSNVMLINPSSKKILKNYGDRPPLGLLYIGAALRERGHNVKVRDLDHTPINNVLNEINVGDALDYVGISVYTSSMHNQSKLLATTIGDKCKKIAGGHHATALPKSLTDVFDAVVLREGENAMLNIIEKGLEGVVDGGMLSKEQITKPDRSLIDMANYKMKQDGKDTATLVTSRGCPNNCAFCSNQTRKVRYHPLSMIEQEVDELKELGYDSLYFYDDCFTANKQRVKDITDMLKTKNITYRITTRAKNLSEDLIKRLKDSGCNWISLGIESGVDKRLEDVNKNMTTNDNYKAVKLCNIYDIKTKGFFMFGLPNETRQDAERTINFSKSLKTEGLTSADFYIMTPFPGTPIYNSPTKYGIQITDKDYTKYLEAGKQKPTAFHRTKFMGEKHIEYIRNKAEEEWKKS